MKWRIVASLLARPLAAAVTGALVTAGALSPQAADAASLLADALGKLFAL